MDPRGAKSPVVLPFGIFGGASVRASRLVGSLVHGSRRLKAGDIREGFGARLCAEHQPQHFGLSPGNEHSLTAAAGLRHIRAPPNRTTPKFTLRLTLDGQADRQCQRRAR